MCGSGVMIGMEIIVVRHSIIRKVLCLASAVCCVGAVGVTLRGTVECRAVTTTFLATVVTTAVCAYSSVYNNQLESI